MAQVTFLEIARAGRQAALAALETRRIHDADVISVFDHTFDEIAARRDTNGKTIRFRSIRTRQEEIVPLSLAA